MNFIRSINIILLVLSVLFFSCMIENKKGILQKQNNVFEFIANDSSQVEFNFTSKRHFENDSVFTDYRLLCSNNTSEVCSIKFSISAENWYIKNGNIWELFYSKNGKLSEIELMSLHKTIRPKRIIKIGNETFYSFTCKDERLNFSTDYNEYLFSPNYGIVIIKNERTFFKRNDFFIM